VTAAAPEPIDVAALRRLLEKAPATPWRVADEDSDRDGVWMLGLTFASEPDESDDEPHASTLAAAAVNALSQLLAALGEREELREEIGKLPLTPWLRSEGRFVRCRALLTSETEVPRIAAILRAAREAEEGNRG